jgi:hypothetical protein
MDRAIVQSLWIGSRLSVMERLSIRSFLRQGYEFHLYSYQPIKNLPRGTVCRDGREILSDDEIFCYQRGYGKGSFSAFSNCFRYKLLWERGGWWSDLDSICLRPLDFAGDHVVGCQRTPCGAGSIAAGLMKAPAGSRVMQYCWETSRQVDRSTVRWGQIGPALLTLAIAALGEKVEKLAPDVFYPVNYWQVWQLVEESRFPEASVSIHLWNSQWRDQGLDPDAKYRGNCIYEQLKTRFGVRSPRNASIGPGLLISARHQLRELKARWRGKTTRRLAA